MKLAAYRMDATANIVQSGQSSQLRAPLGHVIQAESVD